MTVRSLPRRWFASTLLILGVVAALLVTTPSSEPTATAATAAPASIHIAGTGAVGAVNIRQGPSSAGPALGAIPEGATPAYQCFEYGQTVNGVPIWFRISYGGVTGFYSSAYDDAHYQSGAELTGKYGVPSCGTDSSAAVGQQNPDHGATPASVQSPPAVTFYDRNAAVTWAKANWNHNPLIQNDGDCTWFASQALWVGGLPQSVEWAKYSPNGVLGSDAAAAAKAAWAGYSPTNPINPTHIATDADMFVNYLVNNGIVTKTKIDWNDNTAAGAQLGDVIAYDWDSGSDGKIDHVAVVTDYSPGTKFPIVSQHSANRLARFWSWAPNDQHPELSNWIQLVKDYQPTASNHHGPAIAYLIHIKY